jgi:hypothetical protein
MKRSIIAAVAGIAAVASIATAEVIFNSDSGTGFVGKGDVQLALNYSNKQLQDNAGSLKFEYVGTEVTEVSWICTNSRNENTQERERTTTTSTAGVVAAVARVRNQITGFNLNGYGADKTESSTTEGNQLNSCPTNWVLTTSAGPAEVISSTGGLTVNGVPLQ